MINSPFRLDNIGQVVLLAVTLVAVNGCGGGSGAPDKRPERVAFGGTAMLNGATIEDGLITFHPVGSGNGASGKTDSDGKFVMSTFESGDGVVPGEYTVTVLKIEVADAASSVLLTDDPNYSGEPETEVAVQPSNKLPPQFEDPTTSGVKVTVTEANTGFVLEFK